MFNPGLYFYTIDLTKTKVLLNLGLESFLIRAIMSINIILLGIKVIESELELKSKIRIFIPYFRIEQLFNHTNKRCNDMIIFVT